MKKYRKSMWVVELLKKKENKGQCDKNNNDVQKRKA